MTPRKTLIYAITVLILEIILLELWIYSMKPDPSVSIGVIFIVPLLFAINLIIGVVLYFLKKPLWEFFLVNSIICPLIFFAFWNLWFLNYNERYNTEYKFSLNRIIYKLRIEKNSNYFYLSDENDNGRVYVGTYVKKGDSLILRDGAIKMYVIKNKIIGFPEKKTGIELNKTE